MRDSSPPPYGLAPGAAFGLHIMLLVVGVASVLIANAVDHPEAGGFVGGPALMASGLGAVVSGRFVPLNWNLFRVGQGGSLDQQVAMAWLGGLGLMAGGAAYLAYSITEM